MKITVLANRDLPASYALNLLVPELLEHGSLRIFLSSHVGSGADVPRPLRELAFFEQTLCNELLFPALGDSAPGELLSFEALGRRIGSELEILDRINSRRGLERLQSTEPDLVLSIRYGGILRPRAIAVPRLGVLNLHSGLLPRYRGVMATFRALLHGETEIGTTLHTIEDAGIDTGAVIGQTRLAVRPDRSYLWHVLSLYPDGCRLMLDAVDRLRQGLPLEPQPQGEEGAYYTFPDDDELRRFAETGRRLYDLDEVRAFAGRYLAPGTPTS